MINWNIETTETTKPTGYKFQSVNSSETVTLELDRTDQSWSEMQEYFFRFLLGCGFVIDRKDFFPDED